MKSIVVNPIYQIHGSITLPGDYVISQVNLIVAALAHGETQIQGFLNNPDCLLTARAMQAFGAQIDFGMDNLLLVRGTNLKLHASWEPINCGQSRLLLSLLTGLLAGQPFVSKLYGNYELTQEPITDIIQCLHSSGARIQSANNNYTAPLTIRGQVLSAREFTLSVPDPVVKYALILGGLYADGVTTIYEQAPCANHLENALAHFHSPPVIENKQIKIFGRPTLHNEDISIPGDFSIASAWIIASAFLPGSNLTIHNVGLNPMRTGLLTVLLRMGARIRETIEIKHAEPVGSLHIQGTTLRGIEFSIHQMAIPLEDLPLVCVAAALAEGPTIIKDVHTLPPRHRQALNAMCENLKIFGLNVEENFEGLCIERTTTIQAGRISSHGDFSVGLASIILSLFAKGSSLVEDIDCVIHRYPTFHQHWSHLVEDSIGSWQRWIFPASSALPKIKTSRDKIPPRNQFIKLPPQRSAVEKINPLVVSYPVIAIDGPAASGKSTVAYELASILRYAYISTGAMYRAITYKFLQESVNLENPDEIQKTLSEMDFQCLIREGRLVIIIDGENPDPYLRQSQVNKYVSTVASLPLVRAYLLEKQRALAQQAPLVMEGRDIGTAVFPSTPYKFYIDADAEVRYARRLNQGETDLLRERDFLDSTRATAPLQQAPDAILIDSTNLTVRQTVDQILKKLQELGLKW
ncbi:MAG: (d)CMP kinase [Methylacidiphilales bacterium]|nr:(d)CMP kinase [Candidatus Methylacidiphilales bacterium]MDW8349280.1 (d)CMP kinase [Verrucomicrobiae bacterium]